MKITFGNCRGSYAVSKLGVARLGGWPSQGPRSYWQRSGFRLSYGCFPARCRNLVVGMDSQNKLQNCRCLDFETRFTVRIRHQCWLLTGVFKGVFRNIFFIIRKLRSTVFPSLNFTVVCKYVIFAIFSGQFSTSQISKFGIHFGNI